MIFPSDNLGTASKPWAREVTKQLSNIIDISTSNNINNTARDNQLNSSIIAASSAIAGVKTITDAVFVTGTTEINGYNIKAGTINASSINAGELVGFTIKTAASGTRVEMSGTNIRFYYNSTDVGYITGNSTSYGDGMYFGTPADGRFLQISQSWLGFQYGMSNSMGISNGQVMIGGSNGVIVAGTLSGGTASFTTTGTTYLTVANYASIPSITSSLEVQGALNTAQTLRRSTLAGGSLTGASITADGYFQRTSSSARYKQDIEDLNISYDDILQLSPKKFRRKDEVESNPDARYYAGFIAEDIAGSPMDIFAFYQSEKDGGLPDGVYYSEMTSALLIAIKHQDSVIKDLSARIESLENK